MDGYSMSFGSVYMIATWVLVGFSTYALYKLFFNSRDRSTKKESYMDILKKRYAKGEIDSEVYKKIKQSLTEDDRRFE